MYNKVDVTKSMYNSNNMILSLILMVKFSGKILEITQNFLIAKKNNQPDRLFAIKIQISRHIFFNYSQMKKSLHLSLVMKLTSLSPSQPIVKHYNVTIFKMTLESDIFSSSSSSSLSSIIHQPCHIVLLTSD
jgi:hypothetical protein